MNLLNICHIFLEIIRYICKIIYIEGKIKIVIEILLNCTFFHNLLNYRKSKEL